MNLGIITDNHKNNIFHTKNGRTKKKETATLRIKIDSFVTEANIHFPTDYNLL